MPHSDNHPGHLSVYRAFVLQFDTHTDVERGHLAGKVEHVVSGQAIQFHSLETLLGFMAQLLHTERRPVDDGET
jgi:hypothetical protein